MPLPVLTPGLLRRAERFQEDFHLMRMRAGAVKGLGVEVRAFGPLTAIRTEAGFLRSKNRVLGLGAGEVDRLPEALDFFRERGLPCSLALPFDGWSVEVFDALVAARMRSEGSGAVPATIPERDGGAEGIFVRPSPPEERDRYLDLYRRSFATRGEVGEDELRFQWVEDSLPCVSRFVAEIDGVPAGMASVAAFEGMAYLATCGVLPEFRRRGVQRALIRARLGAAFEAGCDLALGGGRLFSPPRRNFEWCGFEVLPLGMGWALDAGAPRGVD